MFKDIGSLSKRNPFLRYFPILQWAPRYSGEKFAADSVAALIVAIMLIPQALAYALVAGMPAETGLYASLFGLTLYFFFGTSNTLSVAPVAVVSLMTAAALAKLDLQTTSDYVAAAFTLTILSGVLLLGLGLLRLGFMANFISHPVISAFVTASAIIIALSQMRHVFGIEASGQTVLELVPALLMNLPSTNFLTLVFGVSSVAAMVWIRIGLKDLLLGRGVSESLAIILSRSGPLFVKV